MTTNVARSVATASAHPGTWILACALAEGIGMTASATAAREVNGLAGLAALGVIVAGGLVEGTALGILQGSWMARRFPGVSRAGWILTTILFAGLGWSLASAPSTLGGADGDAPPVLLMLTGAAALGAVMGALMGAAQALVLRSHVRHPWRWISISAAAWTPTMVIIFAGATLPDASWATGSVVALGAATGLLAGGALGAMSLPLLSTLNGQSVWSGLLARLLRRNLFGLGHTFALLKVTGVVTGRSFEFPVQYARSGDTIIVFPGGAARKTWWRNLKKPASLSIWVDDGWQAASGQVLRSDDREAFDAARAVYTQRWPTIHLGDQAILVRVELASRAPRLKGSEIGTKTYNLSPLQKLANAVFTLMTEMGWGASYRWMLSVPGRTSNISHSTPVDVMNIDGVRYLVAPYGETNWVRNVRAHPAITLRRGSSTQHLVAVSASGESSIPVIREYLRRVPITAPYWGVAVDSPDAELRQQAKDHPVFQLESTEPTSS